MMWFALSLTVVATAGGVIYGLRKCVEFIRVLESIPHDEIS